MLNLHTSHKHIAHRSAQSAESFRRGGPGYPFTRRSTTSSTPFGHCSPVRPVPTFWSENCGAIDCAVLAAFAMAAPVPFPVPLPAAAGTEGWEAERARFRMALRKSPGSFPKFSRLMLGRLTRQRVGLAPILQAGRAGDGVGVRRDVVQGVGVCGVGSSRVWGLGGLGSTCASADRRVRTRTRIGLRWFNELLLPPRSRTTQLHNSLTDLLSVFMPVKESLLPEAERSISPGSFSWSSSDRPATTAPPDTEEHSQVKTSGLRIPIPLDCSGRTGPRSRRGTPAPRP